MLLRDLLDGSGLRMTYARGTLQPTSPSLDPVVVARYAVREDTLQALREFETDVGRG